MAAKKKAWKVGDKFRVKNNIYHGTNYQTDLVYTVSQVNGSGANCSLMGNLPSGLSQNQWISVQHVNQLQNTKSELKDEKTKLQAEIAEIDAKLKFLTDNDLEEYDDNEFKIYQALTILDETTNKLERTKKLAALIKDLN